MTSRGVAGGDRPRWWDELIDRLAIARELHFLGPGEVAVQVEHGLAFASLLVEVPRMAVDLGSGAGLPGLALACLWPESRWLLVESNHRRAAFLDQSRALLRLADRVDVTCERAELVGRQPARRAAADLVVARGFGPPAATAECAAPLLRLGGALVVSEPPGGQPERWPPAATKVLGMAPVNSVAQPVALQMLQQMLPCPDRYPRRVGVPTKRPLWAALGST